MEWGTSGHSCIWPSLPWRKRETQMLHLASFLAALRRCDSRKIVPVCACQGANLNAVFAETDLRLWLHPELSLGNTVVFKSCFAEEETKILMCYKYSLISLNCTVICSVACFTKALATTWSNLLLGYDKHGLCQITCLLLWVLPVSINIKYAKLLVSLPLPL